MSFRVRQIQGPKKYAEAIQEINQPTKDMLQYTPCRSEIDRVNRIYIEWLRRYRFRHGVCIIICIQIKDGTGIKGGVDHDKNKIR